MSTDRSLLERIHSRVTSIVILFVHTISGVSRIIGTSCFPSEDIFSNNKEEFIVTRSSYKRNVTIDIIDTNPGEGTGLKSSSPRAFILHTPEPCYPEDQR